MNDKGGTLDEGVKLAIQYAFAFAAVWGVGGNLEGGLPRDSFDAFARDLFDGTANFPGVNPPNLLFTPQPYERSVLSYPLICLVFQPPMPPDLSCRPLCATGGSRSVYDYRLEPGRNFSFAPWDDVVPKFTFRPNQV